MDLEEKFNSLKQKGEGAFMPHVYFGDPNPLFSQCLIATLVDSGADILEIGIPFSDPTADGPTFQSACERALKNGITPSDCIREISELRERGLDIPIIVTTYYNIPYSMGVSKFIQEIKLAGSQGVIIPNLPIEEADEMLSEGKKHGIHVIFQVTPTTTEIRMKKIVNKASGFIYIVNVEGVTGARDKISDSTVHLIGRLKKHTDLPLLAGYGVSNQKQAMALLSAGADGIIAGSVFAKIYEKRITKPEDALSGISETAKQIKKGCLNWQDSDK